MPIKIGQTPIDKITKKLFGPGASQGINPNKFSNELGSGTDKSLSHPTNGAWRSSKVTKITLYKEKKMGICKRIGKHPAAGFTFFVRYISIVASSISGAAAALANIGPGLGPEIGPDGNYSGLNDIAKWLLAAGMLIGRLELMAVYVLLTATFWRG